MSGLVIEGQLAEPDPARWRCPCCPRSIVELPDDRVTERVCAGHPLTGVTHRPAAMVRAVSAALVRQR